MQPLFIDFSQLSASVTNNALEYIYKSAQDADGIWSPHESPLLRRLIELFSQRGLDRLDAVHQQILAWESGIYHKTNTIPLPRPELMLRWNTEELAGVKLYLELLPPSQWTLDDHMMAVDYVVQRYLPQDQLKTEAEWLATRANLMGTVQANMAAAATLHQADVILAALPSTVSAAQSLFAMTLAQKHTLEFGAARCAENVQGITDLVRHQLRNAIMQHAEEKILGNTGEALQTRLFDLFGDLNRDWRRIAVTEAGESQNQGYIASLKPGTMVKRVEQYKGACAFCRKIDGIEMEVVSPDAKYKDGKKQIWVGKTNIGRSASLRKRVGDVLIARDESELYWVPAGLAHPHCRGRWVRIADKKDGDNADFAAWLKETLA